MRVQPRRILLILAVLLSHWDEPKVDAKERLFAPMRAESNLSEGRLTLTFFQHTFVQFSTDGKLMAQKVKYWILNCSILYKQKKFKGNDRFSHWYSGKLKCNSEHRALNNIGLEAI